MTTSERSKLRNTPQDSSKYLGKEEWMPIVYRMLRLPSRTYIKYPGYVSCVFGFALSIWETYVFLEKFNLKVLFQYAPFYLVEFYITTCSLLWFACGKILYPVIMEFRMNVFWSLNMVSERTQRRILSECRYLQRLYWVHIVLTEVLIIHNLYLWNCDYTKYFILSEIVMTNFPGLSPYFHVISTVLAAPLSLTIISSAWFTHYLVSYQKFQIFMLGDRIEAFTRSTDWKNSARLVFSEEYQEEVKAKLRFFIRRHQQIIKASADLDQRGRQINFWFAFSSGIVGLYTIFTVFSDLFSWFTSCLALFTFMFTSFTMAQRAEFYEDSADELAEIVYDLPWYLWNMENLRTYKIFQQYTSRRILKLPFPSYMMCNYTIIKGFVKLMYSLVNFFQTMRGGFTL